MQNKHNINKQRARALKCAPQLSQTAESLAKYDSDNNDAIAKVNQVTTTQHTTPSLRQAAAPINTEKLHSIVAKMVTSSRTGWTSP